MHLCVKHFSSDSTTGTTRSQRVQRLKGCLQELATANGRSARIPNALQHADKHGGDDPCSTDTSCPQAIELKNKSTPSTFSRTQQAAPSNNSKSLDCLAVHSVKCLTIDDPSPQTRISISNSNRIKTRRNRPTAIYMYISQYTHACASARICRRCLK